MQQTFDFHVHSWWSYDAHLSPEQIFATAEANGVRTVAITDHHNMDGFPAFAAAAAERPAVRWIPGMEATVSTKSRMFDVVALGLPTDAPKQLADVVDRYREWMREINQRMLTGLAALGAGFGRGEADDLLTAWRPGPARDIQGEVRLPNVGLREWLVARGVIADPSEYAGYFDRILEAGGGRPPIPPASEVLPRFAALGATLILAHPKLFLDSHDESDLDAVLSEIGAHGVEAGHRKHTPDQYQRYLAFARARGLLVSGGSDIHFTPDLDLLGHHHCDTTAAGELLARLGL